MSELYHHGILGMKWGVRRYQGYDGLLTEEGKKRYSKDQYKRDVQVYSKGGAKRIARSVDEGSSVSGARSEEAARIKSTRQRAYISGKVGKVAGTVGGVIGSTALNSWLSSKNDVFSDPYVKLATTAAVTSGSAFVGKHVGESIGMLSGGYSPNKYR